MKKIVTGKTASLGQVEGRVTRITSFMDCNKIRPGDIIVATTTSPSMLTYLLLASAIVTDIGGILCHAAVIARELHIPAVVGTGNATELLKDEDFIFVDGNTGSVWLVNPQN